MLVPFCCFFYKDRRHDGIFVLLYHLLKSDALVLLDLVVGLAVDLALVLFILFFSWALVLASLSSFKLMFDFIALTVLHGPKNFFQLSLDQTFILTIRFSAHLFA